jgi:outer membrane immunogenic protein
MKKLAIAVTTIAAFTGSAIAADMSVKAPAAPVPVVRAMSWTGCFVGAGVGYGMWAQNHNAQSLAGVTLTGDSDTAGKGWLGTVQAGCDYQFAPRWVVGAFGDYDFTGLKGNYLSGEPGGAFGAFGSEKERSAWAVGGRVGYLVFPQLNAFMSGGYTQASFDGFTFIDNSTLLQTTSVMSSQTYKGWFLGSGYEYALVDLLPGLFWKTEYRYASYRAENVPVYTGGVLDYNEHAKKDIQTIRSELVYRFNWWN